MGRYRKVETNRIGRDFRNDLNLALDDLDVDIQDVFFKIQEVQSRFNNLVLNESTTEKLAQDALVDDLGNIYNSLNDRLNKERSKMKNSIGVSIEDFPIKPPEVNDTGRIQRAINACKDGDNLVLYKKDDDFIVSSTIIVDKHNLQIMGIGSGYFSPRISCKTPDTTIFDVKSYGVKFSGISINGDATGDYGEGATCTGIRFVRGDGSSDVDCRVKDCTFMRLKNSVVAKGKNIQIEGNVFSTGVHGVVIEQVPGGEVRGIRINNNRFHSLGADSPDINLSICISIAGTKELVYKNQINNNYADGIKTFFSGIANETSISNNELPWCRGLGILVTYSSGGLRLIGNSIQDMYGGNKYTDGCGIILNATTSAIVAFNNVRGKKEHGIQLTNSQRNIIFGNEILDNDWSNTGQYDGIYIDSNSYYNFISDNTIDAVENGKTCGRYGINLQGNENQIGTNFIRNAKNAPIFDARSSNRGQFHSFNENRRVVYSDSLSNATAAVQYPALGDTVVINNAKEGSPYEYVFSSGQWRMGKQAGIKKNNPSNRPANLGLSESGLQYLDTSLAPAGKLITWNGSAWVDCNGNII
ncbi:TPA: right-handed parallel beta-helix repeat-containing protein [Bacillus cereus]